MRILTTPVRLKAACLLWFLTSSALVAFECWFLSQYWSLRWENWRIWFFSVVLVTLPISVWMAGGMKWARMLMIGVSSIWIGVDFWISFRFRMPALAFFGLFHIATVFLFAAWLKSEMTQSYFNPNLRWYEGKPLPILGLQCDLIHGKQKWSLGVSQMDEVGAFLVGKQAPESLFPEVSGEEYELIFRFRQQTVNCLGTPISLLGEKGSENLGLGIRFTDLELDQQKKLGDFVEQLRGEGHEVQHEIQW